jgi:hypothetical protein
MLIYQYRFQPSDDNTLYVAVHANTYDKRLTYLQELVSVIDTSIPGAFENISEPEIEVLAGPCYKHMASVQKRIKSLSYHTPEEIREAFKAKGYYEGLESTL